MLSPLKAHHLLEAPLSLPGGGVVGPNGALRVVIW